MPVWLIIKAFCGGALKSLWGALGGLGRWISRLSPAQLLCIALAGLAAVLSLNLNGEKRHSRKSDARIVVLAGQIDQACAAAGLAAGNPKLDCAALPAQIKALGESIAGLKAGLARQSAAVDELARRSAEGQVAAGKATKQAESRAQAAQRVAADLKASAAKGGDPCQPSDALKGAWK